MNKRLLYLLLCVIAFNFKGKAQLVKDTLWVWNNDGLAIEFGCALYGEKELNGVLLLPGKWKKLVRKAEKGDLMEYYISGKKAALPVHGYLFRQEDIHEPGQWMIIIKYNDRTNSYETSIRRRDKFDRPEYESKESVL